MSPPSFITIPLPSHKLSSHHTITNPRISQTTTPQLPLTHSPPTTTTTTLPKPQIYCAFSSLDTPDKAQTLNDATFPTKTQIIISALRQIFGNCYLSESEIETSLGKIISQFKNGERSVKELVRGFVKSDLYRGRFFESSGPVRFVELNCKHILGRGVMGPEEVSEHVRRLLEEGYEKEMDSYLDCVEYDERFGEEVVPRFIFLGCYGKNDYFNRMVAMRGAWDGCFTSTRSGSTAPRGKNGVELNLGYGDKVGNFVKIRKGLPERVRDEDGAGMNMGSRAAEAFPKNPRAGIRKRIKIAENLYQVFEIPGIVSAVEPAWKKDMGKGEGKSWNGVWF